jgi:RNA recognition motif-containing protein
VHWTNSIAKDVEERRTLFVRNLPLSATVLEVQELFEQFGEAKKALLTKDKATGELRCDDEMV